MVGLDSSTGVAFGHILCYLSFYSYPLEIFLQILIHLVGPQMNRIPRAMRLIHDLAAILKVLWNHEMVLEP
jgi:hypothetical protein